MLSGNSTPESPFSPFQEAERKELDAVVDALVKSSRLLRLLRYIGDRYLQGEIDKLNEYDIATEVFGRSKTTFDASTDAIVRVEAHRLRKRLKEFYENEGQDHQIQISLPSGTYVPVFANKIMVEAVESEVPLPEPEGRKWFYLRGIIAILIAALALSWTFRSRSTAKRANYSVSNPPSVSSISGEEPIRIIAGYSGKPQIDSAGAVWQPDRYFNNGGIWNRSPNIIARTSDPMLFEQWRTGDFFYDIPLRPVAYELHLYFVTSNADANSASTFSVAANGNKILEGFDVNSDAMGANIADERIFRDITPSKDGYLHLAFTSERGAPALSALEILPGLPNKQLPIRLVTQSTPFNDHDGQFWHPDDYFVGGYTSAHRQPIAGTSDPDLFAEERYGHFSYAIPVDTRDRYTLILHFAEFYFGQRASGEGGVGSRVFRVLCNGNTLLDNFDIYKEVGSRQALTKTFYGLKPSAQGKLNISFEPIVNNATVSGIEVLDESK